MSHQQLIILLVILVAVYLLLKKDDPYQSFKKWLARHPQHQRKLGQELCDEIFINPEGKEVFEFCWAMAVNQTPLPDNLLPGNKVLIPLLQEYLREKQGIMVS